MASRPSPDAVGTYNPPPANLRRRARDRVTEALWRPVPAKTVGKILLAIGAPTAAVLAALGFRLPVTAGDRLAALERTQQLQAEHAEARFRALAARVDTIDDDLTAVRALQEGQVTLQCLDSRYSDMAIAASKLPCGELLRRAGVSVTRRPR